eukprot:gene8298-29322_t
MGTVGMVFAGVVLAAWLTCVLATRHAPLWGAEAATAALTACAIGIDWGNTAMQIQTGAWGVRAVCMDVLLILHARAAVTNACLCAL